MVSQGYSRELSHEGGTQNLLQMSASLFKTGQNLTFLEAGGVKTASCPTCQPGHQPVALGRPTPMEGHAEPFGEDLFGALL